MDYIGHEVGEAGWRMGMGDVELVIPVGVCFWDDGEKCFLRPRVSDPITHRLSPE